MSMEEMFYNELEPGVRNWVRLLRNAGINTECSCEHEGWIQCQSLDPTTEIDRIRKTLQENDLFVFTINIIHEQNGPSYSDWHQTLMITSPAFIGEP